MTRTFYREGEGGKKGKKKEEEEERKKGEREGGTEGERKRKHIFVKYKMHKISLSGSLYLAS